MRRSCFLPILILSLAAPLALDAQVRRIATDDAPSFLWADQSRNEVHVFTAGVDRNFNHVLELDSGDIAPRWFVIDGATERLVDSATFTGFFNDFPIRPSVDPAGRRVFLPQLGRIRAFDLDTRALLHDTVVDVSASAVTYDTATNRLLFSIRPGFTEPGIVGCVDGGTFLPLFSAPSNINPGMTGYRYGRADSTIEYYTVCEGTGGADATLSYALYTNDIFSAVNAENLGGGAIAISTTPTLVALAFNGDTTVRLLDAATHRELPISPIATAPYKPVTIDFDPFGHVLVGTASGMLLVIDTTSGTIIDSIDVRGQIEAMTIGRDTTAYLALGPGRDSTVVVVDLAGRIEVDQIAVDGRPVALLIDENGDLHVFANTADSMRWTKRDPIILIESDSRTLPGTLYRPARVAYDERTDQVVVVLNDTVIAFSNTDAQLPLRLMYSGTVRDGMLSGVTHAQNRFLVTELSIDSVTSPGYVHIVDSDGSVEGIFAAGPRPIAAAGTNAEPRKARGFYVFDRGARGGQRSLLTLFQFAPSIFEANDTLGRTANHILIVDDAGVTMNGSHEIVAVDLGEWMTGERFPMGTDGFNGPRESILIDNDTLVTSTYNGDVRVTSVGGGYRVFQIGGKGEGMAFLPAMEKLFIAIPFAPDYTADSVVVVFNTSDLVASVERTSPLAALIRLGQNSPNPASDRTAITFLIDRPDHVVLDLHTIDGRQVARLLDRDMKEGSFSVEVRASELTPGTYIYTLRTSRGVESRTMTIVR